MPRNKPITSTLTQKAFHMKICTWNVQGKTMEPIDRANLVNHLSSRKVHVAALQETKFSTDKAFPSVFDDKLGKLILLNPADTTVSKKQQYGLGFYVAPELLPHIHGMRSISNRIGVLRLKMNETKSKTSYLTIVNAYAPHSVITAATPEATDEFYDQLYSTYEMYRNSSLLVICGDFNAKLGKKQPDDIEETIVGRHGKGFRNENGQILASFLHQTNLLASNTCFQHPMRHRTTWISPSLRNHLGKFLHNQIDYVLVPQSLALTRHFLLDARSYASQSFDSDHKSVITRMDLTSMYKRPRHAPKVQHRRYEVNLLRSLDTKFREKFEEEMTRITSDLASVIESRTAPRQLYLSLVQKFHEAAAKTLPRQPKDILTRPSYIIDPVLTALSNRRKQLKARIESSKNPAHVTKMRRIRYQLVLESRERLKTLRVNHINGICAELERNIGNKRCFEAMRLLQRINHKPLHLTDEDGHHLHTAEELGPLFKTYFEQFFNQPDHSIVDPWISEEPTPLEDPIRPEETEAAITFLNNNRASGPDELPPEMFKYGGPHIIRIVTDILNGIFAQNCYIEAMLDGLLILINKPNNKAKKPDNCRPITLLNTIRKILSTITLFRTRDAANAYISITQSGSRSGRSTSDMLWCYRWVMAITQKYQLIFRMVGIDLSKAFDCVNRSLMLEALTDDEVFRISELRCIRYLLSFTRLRTRIKGHLGPWFSTNAGIPQGDALSPLLFALYLEVAVRRFKASHPEYGDKLDHLITHYADDTDFIDLEPDQTLLAEESYAGRREELREFVDEVDEALTPFNLRLNKDKTEYTLVNRKTAATLAVKNLGTILDPIEDVKRRVDAAEEGFSTYWKLWLRKDDVPFKTKLRLYNAAILPILLYNLHTGGLTPKALRPIDVCHRRHLRRMLGIFYPDSISNVMLYITTETHPPSASVVEFRWRLFGHILRSPINTPANVAMIQYFRLNHEKHPKYRGSCPFNIQSALNDDLLRYEQPTDWYCNRRSPSVVGLDDHRALLFYRRKEADRDTWRALVRRIRDGYERDYWRELCDDESVETVDTQPYQPTNRRLRRRGRRRSDSTSSNGSGSGVSSASRGRE